MLKLSFQLERNLVIQLHMLFVYYLPHRLQTRHLCNDAAGAGGGGLASLHIDSQKVLLLYSISNK